MADKLVPIIKPTGEVQTGFGGSKQTYRVMQVRPLPSEGAMRIQCFKAESDIPIDQKLMTYLASLPCTVKSLAGSNAPYAQVLVRRVKGEPKGFIRIQIPGPKLNREYGACVVVKAPDVYAWSSIQSLEGA